jgi:hypothetical protein
MQIITIAKNASLESKIIVSNIEATDTNISNSTGAFIVNFKLRNETKLTRIMSDESSASLKLSLKMSGLV